MNRLRRDFWTDQAVIGLLVVAAFCTAVGCGANRPPSLGPNVQPEGQVAFHASQIIGFADTALGTVEAVTDARLAGVAQPSPQAEVIKADARSVIQVIQTIGQGGKDLAVVLRAVDQAKDETDRTAKLATARTAVLAFTKTVSDASLKAGPEGSLRNTVLRMLGQVGETLVKIGMLLPER